MAIRRSTTVRANEQTENSKLPVYFRPGELWNDVDGNLIQAHGGAILLHQGVYYWYGEDKSGPTYKKFSLTGDSTARVDVIGVRCYSSTDLSNWQDEGLVLSGGRQHHRDLAPSMVLERPKVLYNDLTRTFVMWMHIDDADYAMARAGVAVARSPTGPFTFIRSFRPNGQQSRDLTVFKDDDATAYIVYSSEGNQDMHIAKLSPDYTEVQPQHLKIFIGRSREAPAVFKHDGLYFMLTSGCTGWEPNQAEVHWASDMFGQWTLVGHPCVGGTEMDAAVTFQSQGTFVLPVPGRPGRFIFMGDQWDPDNLAQSRYVWLPLWVLPVQNTQQRARGAALAGGNNAMLSSDEQGRHPGGNVVPADVVVRWHDLWRFSDFDRVPKSRWEAGRLYHM
ncbi:g7867 [Coccomyxa elongata]